MALLQMVQVWSIVISGVIVNVAAGVVYGVWRAFAICLVSSSLAHGVSFTLYQRLGKYLDKFLPDNGLGQARYRRKVRASGLYGRDALLPAAYPERLYLHRSSRSG